MLERALIAVAVVALFALAVAFGRRWYAWRNARIEARVRAEGSTTATGTPRIVYFTTATCVICKVQQEPAMTAVAARVPDLLIQRHDAVEEGELAKQYGVLSVPTTAVYRRDGTLVTINRGFTPAAALLAQIEDRTPDIDGGHEMASEAVA
jgi:thiol:disulfide interchange protein